jgi:hypothetical protein
MIQRELRGTARSKQIFYFDVNLWLGRQRCRTSFPLARPQSSVAAPQLHAHPFHARQWEYPWFSPPGTAFQCTTIALIDPGFAADNLWFLLFEQFQHQRADSDTVEITV